jgi:hypothetical protein
MMPTNPEIEKIAQQLYNLQNQGVTLSVTAEKGSFEHILSSVKAIGDAFNFKDRFSEMDKAAYAMDQYAASTSRVFGTTREQMRGIKTIAADSFNQITLMGGGLTAIQEGQESITKSFNTNVLATKQNILDLTLVNKTTGVAAETLVSSFRTAGFSVSHINDEMQKTVDYTRSVGVNVKETSERFTKNLGQLNLFNFQNGTEGLAKMAATSTMLGINMEKTFTLAEKLLDPQAAIDLSASLQRLGVTSSELLDPLRAMDLAQNDPEELQRQLVEVSKQFVKTKEDGTFEIMKGSKRQLREVATQLGMTAAEFSDMALKSADFDKKMSEMRMPSFNMTEENKTLFANMAQFNKGTGQYEITYTRKDKEGKDETVTKVVSEIPEEDLDAIAKASQPKTLEDLNKEQLSTQEKMLAQMQLFNESKVIGYAASEMGEEIIKGVQKQQENMFKDFNDKLLKSSENIFRTNFDKAYGKEMKGKEIESVSDLGKMIKEGMREGIISTFSTTKDVVKGMTKENGMGGLAVDLGVVTQDDLDKLGKVVDDFTTIIASGVKNLDTIINTGMKQLTQGLRTTREGGTERLKSIFENIVDLNDFIMTKDGVYRYQEDDIMIGGTNLDGKNNTTNLEETLTTRTPPTQGVTTGESRISIDLIPLTTLMSEYVKTSKPQTIDPLKLMELSQTNSVELQNNMVELSKQFVKTKDDGSFEIPSEYKKQLTEVAQTLGIGAEKFAEMGIKSVETVRNTEQFKKPDVLKINETTVPTYNPPQLATLERHISTPTQKIEFGNLEISLKVDIPNNANVSTDQVKEVLQTAMNSTEFKQKIVVAITEANSNYGLTSVGGTSNYGANKTNYSLNT